MLTDAKQNKMPNYDVVYNKEDYLRHMEQLTPTGYSFNNNEGYFYKKENNRLIEIHISSSLYFPDSARYKGATTRISFYDVETLFSEVLKQYSLQGYLYQELRPTCGTGHGTIQDYGQTVFNFLVDKDVETDTDFEEVKPYLQQAINHCLTFSDQYGSHNDLYLAFIDLPISEKVKVISQPFPFKWAIILKLNDDPNYESYIDDLIVSYGNKNRPDGVAYLTALKERLSQL